MASFCRGWGILGPACNIVTRQRRHDRGAWHCNVKSQYAMVARPVCEKRQAAPGGGPRLITSDLPGGWSAPPGTCPVRSRRARAPPHSPACASICHEPDQEIGQVALTHAASLFCFLVICVSGFSRYKRGTASGRCKSSMAGGRRCVGPDRGLLALGERNWP